ncbi:hypothetical protein HS125_14115 [bacterium]|nr:hypothetical protein [bacterium]
MHPSIDLDEDERREMMQVKIAEKRFRAALVNNRDRIAFFFGAVAFVWILFLCVMAGKSPLSAFVYSMLAMLVMGVLGFACGTLLLRCTFTEEFARQHMRKAGPRTRRVRMTVRADRAQPGMILERAALAADGRQVLLSGTRLTAEDILKLRQAGAREISVITEIQDVEESETGEAGAPQSPPQNAKSQ